MSLLDAERWPRNIVITLVVSNARNYVELIDEMYQVMCNY